MARNLKNSQFGLILLILIVIILIMLGIYYLYVLNRGITGGVVKSETPSIFIISAPDSEVINTPFTISWEINSSKGITSNTQIGYGDTRVISPQNSYDYLYSSQDLCTVKPCNIPNSFSVSFQIDRPGNYYYRAYATVNGKTYWSNENKIVINTELESTNPNETSMFYNIGIGNTTFYPNILKINVGDKVLWKNNDIDYHTITSDSGNELNSGTLAPGGMYSHIFQKAGNYSYHCSLDKSMHGEIIVESIGEYNPEKIPSKITRIDNYSVFY
ncbi:Plastocyanin [uncultured archaeon]|nr:Plastocyanin [uncultured archaeon]